MTPKEFVNKYRPFAKQTEAKTGISATFILAQAALETGWGKNTPGNMMFGIKAKRDTPHAQRQLIVTREVLNTPNDTSFPEVLRVTKRKDGRYGYRVKDWFMRYDSPEASFTAHANLLIGNERYAKALEVRSDAKLFATAIAQSGYATDPNYAKVLKGVIKMIEQYV